MQLCNERSGFSSQELFQEVFRLVPKLVDEQGLLNGKTVGVDSAFPEANAAMKLIVRKDTGDNWEQYLKGLAEKYGVPIENKADLIRYDKQWNTVGKQNVCSFLPTLTQPWIA